ncbi:hypothetical protein [Sabulicella glaciei]|uniref:Uncharacterized protein n=1 Tax=Sabulicella glaciei TaxID=2984948 RepID=A0ABT3NQX2_9PROT|nr:hypothetical protein [Roseococcus sp. MDT2-1-1]MCW8084551.1 hypothetical protein [Roseococcus sp. MDT2-1-1]
MRTKAFLTLLLLAGACAPLPQENVVYLPADAVPGAGDPTRSAITSVAGGFDVRGRPLGTLADAARNIANLEYLTENTSMNNPALDSTPVNLPLQLRTARREWRQALGIPADAPPQLVVNQYYGAARSLETTGASPISLAALQARPVMPATAAAAALAGEAVRGRGAGAPVGSVR